VDFFLNASCRFRLLPLFLTADILVVLVMDPVAPPSLQEEEHERLAMAEAEQFKAWQKVLGVKKRLANAARRRSLIELRAALDLAGQVGGGGGSVRFRVCERSCVCVCVDVYVCACARRCACVCIHRLGRLD